MRKKGEVITLKSRIQVHDKSSYGHAPYHITITRLYGRVIPGNMVALDCGRVEYIPYNVWGTLGVGERAVIEYVGRNWFAGNAEPVSWRKDGKLR